MASFHGIMSRLNKLLVCSLLCALSLLLFYTSLASPTAAEAEQRTTSDNGPSLTRISREYHFKLKWGSVGSSNGQFTSPRGIAYDKINGWIYVADQVNNRVQRFTTGGDFLTAWDGLDQPYGVAVAADGSVYVTNSKAHQVVKFDINGNKILVWGEKGKLDRQFRQPLGIALDQGGFVYVADSKNNRIQKFTADGGFVSKWSYTGSESPSSLDYPYGVAVDEEQNIYVADTAHHRIVKFDNEGNPLFAWGEEGSGNGRFEFPRTIAVDQKGHVFVADAENNRVQMFNKNGRFLSVIGSLGGDNGELNKPHGVASEPSGKFLYIADTYNNRIQKFQRGDTNLQLFGNGSDGNLTVSLGATHYLDKTRTSVTSPGSSGLAINVVSTKGFRVGNEVLIHQTQGPSAGTFEFRRITGVSRGKPGTLYLNKPLEWVYVQLESAKAQVIRVPNFQDVQIESGGVLTAHEWDGATGGILVFRSNGTLSVYSGALIEMSSKGFRGGIGKEATSNLTGDQGESILGSGTGSILPNVGGGGGSTAPNDPFSESAGGGGGGYATEGEEGGYYGLSSQGSGGATYGNLLGNNSFLGSGGGAAGGTGEYWSAPMSSHGGNGGGVIQIFANMLEISGTLRANGDDGESVGNRSGGGGAGSGGDIILTANDLVLGSELVLAVGGLGGAGSTGDPSNANKGGNGGMGRILIEYCSSLIGTTNPPATTNLLVCP